MGKHHHTWSQRSQLCKQQLLISVALLLNFLFVPNWKSEDAVFSSLLLLFLVRLDIKYGLTTSKVSSARHKGEKTLLFPSEAIDFQATYALFVCADTLECKLVKCEVHHLSPAGSPAHLAGAYQHINTHTCTYTHAHTKS